jgi:hypothetical protein
MVNLTGLVDKQHEGSRKTKPTYQAVAIYEIMEVEKIIGGMHVPVRGQGQGQGGVSGDESEGDETSSEDDDEEDEGGWP